MMPVALSLSETNLWYVALAVGGVVIVVVVALLTLLLFLVRSIEIGAAAVLGVAQEVAGNTAKVNDVSAVVSTLEALGDEADQHAKLLGAS
jgi:hypothetical protein